MSSKNSQCETYVPMLDAFVDNELDGSETNEVAIHVQSCDDCQRQAKEIEALKSSLSSLPRRKMSRDLADNLDAILGNKEAAVTAPKDNVVSIKARRGWIMALASAAAVVVIALAGSMVFKNAHQEVANLPPEKQSQSPDSAATKGATEIAQNSSASEVRPEAAEGRQRSGNNPALTEIKTTHSSDSHAIEKIASTAHHDSALGTSEIGMTKTTAAQKSVDIAQAQPSKTTIAASDGISKTSIMKERPASSELLALYEEDEGTDVGMTTDEDGLYAIKL